MNVNVLPDFSNFQQRFLEARILLDSSFCLRRFRDALAHAPRGWCLRPRRPTWHCRRRSPLSCHFATSPKALRDFPTAAEYTSARGDSNGKYVPGVSGVSFRPRRDAGRSRPVHLWPLSCLLLCDVWESHICLVKESLSLQARRSSTSLKRHNRVLTSA